MVRHATIDRVIGGVDAETFFTLACNSDTYAACHGGDHPGGMLDVRVGAWGGLAEGGSAAADAAELKSALSTASASLAASAPKKGWAARKAAAAKAKGGVGAADEATTSTPPAPDPARPAVRALAYRMPPDWGDGWMTKLAPAMNIEESQVRRRCADAAGGGELAIETSIKWSRLAPPAVIMRYNMAISPAGLSGTRVSYEAAIDTASLPLPPPIRAVIEISMAASFHALVSKFVAFATDTLGGEMVEQGGGLVEEGVAGVARPGAGGPSFLPPPRSAASPRAVAPPAPNAATADVPPAPNAAAADMPSPTPRAAWASLIPSRHIRTVHQDTEGREYWDAAETPRGLDAVWEGGGSGGGGTVPGTPTAAACA